MQCNEDPETLASALANRTEICEKIKNAAAEFRRFKSCTNNTHNALGQGVVCGPGRGNLLADQREGAYKGKLDADGVPTPQPPPSPSPSRALNSPPNGISATQCTVHFNAALPQHPLRLLELGHPPPLERQQSSLKATSRSIPPLELPHYTKHHHHTNLSPKPEPQPQTDQSPKRSQ